MKQEEKLIYLGAGINSRFLGIVISSISCIFLILFLGLLFFPAFDLGSLKFKSQSISCTGINSIIQNQKMRSYEITKNLKDLPNNCKIKESSTSYLLIGGLILFSIFLFFFFFRCKKIVLKGDQVNIYNGNVFFYRFQQIKIGTVTQIRLYPVDKRLLVLPYKIVAIELASANAKISLDTNLAVTRNQKDVNYFADGLKRDLIPFGHNIALLNQCVQM